MYHHNSKTGGTPTHPVTPIGVGYSILIINRSRTRVRNLTSKLWEDSTKGKRIVDRFKVYHRQGNRTQGLPKVPRSWVVACSVYTTVIFYLRTPGLDDFKTQ